MNSEFNINEDHQPSYWQLVIKFSLIYALSIIFVTLFFSLFLANYQTSWFHNVIQYFIVAMVLIFGMKSRRDEQLDGRLSYGQGLKIGMMIGVCAAVLISLYQIIHMTFIDPDFMRLLGEETKRQMIERGNSEEQIEQAMFWMRKMQGPGMMFIMSFLGSFLMSLIFSLVLALFIRKDTPETESVN